MDPSNGRYFDQLASAAQAGRLTASARKNIEHWLTAPYLGEYAPAIQDHIRREGWQVLQDAFWTTIPFGTAGRRGRMAPFGPNAINDRTIGETVQALAGYVRDVYDGAEPPTCAIAYDTRNRSEQFARLSAEIMLAAGFDVLFFEGFRATPLLATTVRYKHCACGIMISASHNPPSDNAIKVFWSDGAQLSEPHDREVTSRMEEVAELRRESFSDGIQAGRIRYVAEEMDAVYRDAVLGEGFGLGRGPRDLRILYSPLHGVGSTSVTPVLRADGFSVVSTFSPHAEPNGCFPNVPNHIANPEELAVFDAPMAYAAANQYDIVLASDPDADRLGCAAPLRVGSDQWRPLTGNQIAVLLTDYVCRKRSEAGSLSPEHYIVKTLVTTEMMRAVAASYGIRTFGDCLTGFKWIGRIVDEQGPEYFVLGAEEAHGYLVGDHLRDKDGAVAAMLLAELAAETKSKGQTLHQALEQLYDVHGRFVERTVSQSMPGADGMKQMQAMMQRFRNEMPMTWGEFPIARRLDYQRGRVTLADGTERPLDGPQGDLILFELEAAGHRIAVRPSGTEPKIKFYLFTRMESATNEDAQATLDRMEQGIGETR